MMEELQVNPALNFERIVCHDHSNFILSPNNMSLLKQLKERLTDQVEQAKSQVQEKTETLISLWDYLDEPLENREIFLETYTGYGSVTLNAVSMMAFLIIVKHVPILIVIYIVLYFCSSMLKSKDARKREVKTLPTM